MLWLLIEVANWCLCNAIDVRSCLGLFENQFYGWYEQISVDVMILSHWQKPFVESKKSKPRNKGSEEMMSIEDEKDIIVINATS